MKETSAFFVFLKWTLNWIKKHLDKIAYSNHCCKRLELAFSIAVVGETPYALEIKSNGSPELKNKVQSRY